MATTATLNNILDEAGFKSERGRAMLIDTAKDIMKRIDRNFQRLGISPYNKQGKMRTSSGVDASGRARGKASEKPTNQQRGSLRRSIHWQIFNATGGDDALIKFYTQNVTSFVKLAVQGNMLPKGADGFNSWKVRHGGLPKAITSSNYDANGGITVGRTNKGQTLRRKAKPFISGEIRVHGRILFDRLVQHYAYVGNMVMASALDVREIVKYVDANQKTSKTAKINRKTGIQDFTDLRSIESILEEMIYNRNNDVAALEHSGWKPGAHSSDRTREWLDNH